MLGNVGGYLRYFVTLRFSFSCWALVISLLHGMVLSTLTAGAAHALRLTVYCSIVYWQ